MRHHPGTSSIRSFGSAPAVHDGRPGRDRCEPARHEPRVVDFYRSLGSTFFGAVVSTCGVHAASTGSQRRPDSCPTTVTVVGDLDLANAPVLRACFASVDGHVDVECSGLGFVDREGLGVLTSTQARTDADFVFVEPSRSLVRLLRATGLDASLEFRPAALPVR
jgi:anti-anti-sigma factor